MTISPYSVAEAIEECQETIYSLVEEIRAAGPAAAQAETDFEREFAKKRIEARACEGRVTEDMARDAATVATSDLRLSHLIAKNNLTTLRAALSAMEHKMDGYRTMAASVRVAGG